MQLFTAGCFHILFTGLFSPPAIFVLLHLQTGSPRFEFTQKQLCLKRDGIRPALKSSADNEGRRGENKTEANISLYTVFNSTQMKSDIQFVQ